MRNRFIAAAAHSALVGFLALALLPVKEAAALDQNEFNKAMDAYLQKDENVGKIGTALEGFFKKKRDDQQKAAAEEEAKQVEEQFKNPVKIDVANRPVRGNPNAKVTLVIFSDFQCPFCQRGAQVMDDVLKDYPNDVKLVFKHLPLPFHENAGPASKAAMAAGEQGKFWEMHDQLFKNQQNLTPEGFIEMAKAVGADVEKFKADLAANDAKYQKVIDEDSAKAAELGVQGTPGFFVNGVQVRGARPLPYFKSLIDRWLKQGK